MPDPKITLTPADNDFATIKAELIRMRKYILHHSIPIGECVAWSKLKRMFDVGIKDQDDWDWLAEYEARTSEAKAGIS